MHVAEKPAPSDLYITLELHRRAPRTADYLGEKLALQDIGAQMLDNPEALLPKLVERTMQITGASSAGISVFEPEEGGAGIFRWRDLRGALARFEGTTTPRNHSPCGVCLDRFEPTLTRHPERHYGWIAEAGLVCPEVLLVPLYMAHGQPLGTLWIVSEAEGYFDSGHARIMRELASFVGIALAMLDTQQRLRAAVAQQGEMQRALRQVAADKELLVQEAHHRVKNSLQMLQGLLLMQARASAHPEVAHELRQSAARINTFGTMHEHLYRVGTGLTVDLGAYLDDLVTAQKEALASTLEGRNIALDAASAWWPASGAPSIGLIVLELVTNALKHGAGTVTVTLRRAGEALVLTVEDEGQALEAGYEPAQSKGLGMRVLQGLLRGQRGKLTIDRSRGHTCFVATMQASEAKPGL